MGNELHFSDTKTPINVTSSFDAVIQPLAYFDIFNFPLTLEEIVKFSPINSSASQCSELLNELIKNKKVIHQNNYYQPSFSSTENINTRAENQKRAKSIEQRVKRYSRLISRFPYVRCVCISGSYSKGVIAKDGDIDFFIITQPGRLWLSRTLLVLYKKIILLNSRKYFCVNYFIDSDHLEIPDKNLFSATEIVTLMPAYNRALYQQFVKDNNWTNNLLPNASQHNEIGQESIKTKGLKALLEKILNGSFGEKLDSYCFKITLKRWKKKFKHFNEVDFDLNMRTKKNVSKHHPQGFQNKVLIALQERLKKFKV